MLREIVLAATKTENERKGEGISCSGLFPCPYRLYLVEKELMWLRPPTPVQKLNMEDGWDQEEQAVARLKRAKVEVIRRGEEVTLGKAKIKGHIDGVVTLAGISYVWEHKARRDDTIAAMKQSGLKFFPDIKSQANAYMLGLDIPQTIIQTKDKENNDIFDFVIRIDLPFIEEILEWVDKIKLEGWIPEPKETEYCSHCGVNCFLETQIDMSGITDATAPEMAEKWRQAKQLIFVGTNLEEVCKAFFTGEVDKKTKERLTGGLIGDNEVLFVEDLKIKKIKSHKSEVSKTLLLENYGPDALALCTIETPIEYYVIKDERSKDE